MSDSVDRVKAITQLQTEIATLEKAISSLASLPAAQQPLRQQLIEKQHRLVALEAGGPLASATQIQTGGVNFGIGTSIGSVGDVFTGDKVMGDKFTGNKTVNHGPTINGSVSAGRDVNLATNQTINNAGLPPVVSPTQTVTGSMPNLRLWLEDTEGQEQTTLTVGEEAVLRLGLDGDAALLGVLNLRLEADAAGVEWPDGTSRPLVLKPGAKSRAMRWAMLPEQVGTVTFKVLVLARGMLVQHLSLAVHCREAGGTLSNPPGALAQPAFSAPVGLALQAVGSLPAHAKAVTLIIDQGREGYELRLLEGGRINRCRLALTDHAIAEMLAHARTELLAVVYARENTTYVFQQSNLAIPQTHAEQALARLARLGAYLWNSLFDGAGSGPDSAAIGARLRRLSQSASLHVTVAAAHLPFPGRCYTTAIQTSRSALTAFGDSGMCWQRCQQAGELACCQPAFRLVRPRSYKHWLASTYGSTKLPACRHTM